MKARAPQQILVFVCMTFLAGVAFADSPVKHIPREFKQPKTLAALLALKPEDLEKVDTARMNLLCAVGLRGAEDLNIEKTLKTLDRWTKHVETETSRNYHRFTEHPEEYQNSVAYYRMAMLAMVLQEDFGTHYDPDRALPQLRHIREPNDVFYADSGDVFVHGLLGGERHGTCSSLPVLYTAVAQRLGYPVHLAAATEHLYLRYEEGTNHLNVDAAGEGFIAHPDEEYRKWPHPISDEDIKTYGFLQPMSQQQALGAFLAIRAGCLTSMKKFDEAAESWEAVSRYLSPTPVLNEIVARAKERASEMHKADRWDELWDQVVQQPIPDEATEYFQDRQAQILLLMNRTTDIAAIERAAAGLNDEVQKYAKEKTTDTHQVKYRISFVPPPVRLLQSPGQNIEVASMTAPIRTIRIRAERVPHDYWQSIPPELQQRLRGLNNETQIVSEMNAYHVEQANRQVREAQEQATRNLRRESERMSTNPASPGLPSDPHRQIEQDNARRIAEMNALLMQPGGSAVLGFPLTGPAVRIEIIPPQTGEP